MVNLLTLVMIKKRFKKILVPLDGSKNSFRGLETAIALARNFDATITSVFSISLPSNSEFKGIGSVEKNLSKQVKKIMEKAKVLCAQNGIVFNSKILHGDPGFNIINLANKGNFDMIVIGSRGRGSLREMFFGSVSNYVVHTSKIPVLVVK